MASRGDPCHRLSGPRKWALGRSAEREIVEVFKEAAKNVGERDASLVGLWGRHGGQRAASDPDDRTGMRGRIREFEAASRNDKADDGNG